jgi:NADPH-dependent glutamate synthase beta subunit-like oxidoreductase
MELPIGATAIAMPPVKRQTGLWRYKKPLFEDRIPPCEDTCPLGNWIQRFIAEFSSENLEEAWRILKLENPFPGVCGRVCYHPCEGSCNRLELEGATKIHSIERYLADHFSEEPVKPQTQREKQASNVAVVGSGPAGLACAYFLAGFGYGVTVFEAENRPGGIPQMGIPEYRLPRDILDKEIADILSLGIELKTNCRVGKDVGFEDLLEYDAVFLATGAHQGRALDIPGEEHEGVFQGLEFLKRFNLGDPLDLGDNIVIIGGGNTAIDVTRTVLRMGRQAGILYRRTRNEMPAYAEEIDDALAEGSQLQHLISPVAIRKNKQGGLSIDCARMKLEGRDKDGRMRPVPIEGETVSFEADNIILATGEVPDLNYLPEDFSLQRAQIPVNEWGQTTNEKIFAGGDIIAQPWTIADAIGSAKRAAIAIDVFLREGKIPEDPRGLPRTVREHLGFVEPRADGAKKIASSEYLNLAYEQLSPGMEQGKLSPEQRVQNFEEVQQGMTFDDALREAKRCLSCGVCRMCGNCYLFCPDSCVYLDEEKGRYVIDYEFCKGCGICHNECPVATIELEAQGED